MPRITKRERERAKRDGRPPRYLCVWTDENGKRRQKLAFTDKRVAARYEMNKRERAERIRTGLESPADEASRAHQTADISAHLDAFERHLAVAGAGGRRRAKPSVKYVAGVRTKLERFVAWTGPRTERPIAGLRDVTMDRAVAWIDALESDGWTTATGARRRYSGYSINEFIGALTMFGSWTEQTGRLPDDPLKAMRRRRRTGLESDRTHERRAISPAQIADLIRAAGERPLIAAKTLNRGPRKGEIGARVSQTREAELSSIGRERAALYLTLFWTGLRRSEARALRWGDVVLDGAAPLLRLRAHTTKAKRADVIAMHPELSARLRAIKAERSPSPSDDVFRVIPDRRTFRRDLEAAGIEALEGERHFDMHAIRVSLTTFLAGRGVGQRLAQAHLRHSDPKLTAVTYTDTAALPVAEAIRGLPPITAASESVGGGGPDGQSEDGDHSGTTGLAAYAPRTAVTNGRCDAPSGMNGVEMLAVEQTHKSLPGHDLPQSVRIGVRGFEPPTFSSRTRRATKLRYTP